MFDLTTALVALAGLLIRYGLPILFMGVTVWLLRRLDARWQAEARGTPVAAPPVMAGPACWQVNGCAPDRRAECPAFLNAATPCWQVFRDHNGNLRAGCLVCEFFRAAPAPVRVAPHHTVAR
jgi:hypothetical protein